MTLFLMWIYLRIQGTMSAHTLDFVAAIVGLFIWCHAPSARDRGWLVFGLLLLITLRLACSQIYAV